MFTGPVGPVEVFFHWPKSFWGNFYWPGASGSLLASSPATKLCELEMFENMLNHDSIKLVFACLLKMSTLFFRA